MPTMKLPFVVIFVLVFALPMQMEHGFAEAETFFNPFRAASTIYRRWETISSLVQSLLTRVANLRASRADYAGAQRARKIAEGLDSSVRWWRTVGSIGWDYVAHYAWRNSFSRPSDYSQIFFHFNELLSAFGELMQLRSESEKAQWISRNYQRILGISKSLLRELLAVFSEQGALRESMLAIQKEIAEGDLMRDSLQIGAADLKGLVQVAKDMMASFFGPQPMKSKSTHSEL